MTGQWVRMWSPLESTAHKQGRCGRSAEGEVDVACELVPRDLVVAVNVKLIELGLELDRAASFRTRDDVVFVDIGRVEQRDVPFGGPPIVVSAIVCKGERAHEGDRE